MHASKLLPVLVAIATLTACEKEVPVGGRDGGPPVDAGALDAGPLDAGSDSGPLDAGSPDASTPCTASADCGTSAYCHKPFGMCAGPGFCETYDASAICDLVPANVCGCDGHTYNTACDARRAGMSVDHVSNCPPLTDGCISDLDCEGGWFCEFPMGSCGGTGTCVDRGIGFLCATICDPQCACDGTTYENECLRHKAAASLMQSGTCPGSPPPCTMGGACCATGADCTVGQECVGMGGPMKCIPIPPSPGCWQDLDCGTGHTCMDPYICPCGSSCPRPDTEGTCT